MGKNIQNNKHYDFIHLSLYSDATQTPCIIFFLSLQSTVMKIQWIDHWRFFLNSFSSCSFPSFFQFVRAYISITTRHSLIHPFVLSLILLTRISFIFILVLASSFLHTSTRIHIVVYVKHQLGSWNVNFLLNPLSHSFVRWRFQNERNKTEPMSFRTYHAQYFPFFEFLPFFFLPMNMLRKKSSILWEKSVFWIKQNGTSVFQ